MRVITFEANPNKYRQTNKTAHDTLAIKRKKERNTILCLTSQNLPM